MPGATYTPSVSGSATTSGGPAITMGGRFIPIPTLTWAIVGIGNRRIERMATKNSNFFICHLLYPTPMPHRLKVRPRRLYPAMPAVRYLTVDIYYFLNVEKIAPLGKGKIDPSHLLIVYAPLDEFIRRNHGCLSH
jgi:hypothetical protein